MGKKSIKANKSIYQISREDAGLTREKASEKMEFISADRIEKIESGKSQPHPDEVLIMGDAYNVKNLRNYYCSHECPIGQHYVPEIQTKELSQIILEMLSSLNTIYKQKDRLIEITADGEIQDDEIEDFVDIQTKLKKISISVESLSLWVEQTISNGQINKELLEQTRKEKGLI